MRKCATGFICFENVSTILLILVLFVFIYFLFKNQRASNVTQNVEVKAPTTTATATPGFLSWPYTNLGLDTYLNPMAPPLRDERYIVPAVPINVPTNVGYVDTNYRQLGIMTPLNQSSKDSILPLMGRPLYTNRDKWNYYTISNQHNNVKLPVSKNGRSCTNEYGCDKLYNGDTVYVEGANEPYKVTIYENDVIRYLPFI